MMLALISCPGTCTGMGFFFSKGLPLEGFCQVIAEAAKINKVRTFVNLSDNEIGPENAEVRTCLS